MPPAVELTVLLPGDISAPDPPPLNVVDRIGPNRVVILG